MTGRMQWSRQQQRGRPVDQAFPRHGGPSGPWSHVKRQPVKRLSKAEIAALLAERPDLQPPRSRARRSDDER